MTRNEAIEKVVKYADSEVGYPEGAGNWNKYAEDPRLQKLYGWKAQYQPWCDLFTDEVFIECFGLEAGAAMTYQPIGGGSAACRTSASFFQSNGAWFTTPEVGDVIFFYYSGEINHQGIVVATDGNVVNTVEGNSSDKVSKRSYRVGDPVIAGFGRPKYELVCDDADEAKVDEPSDHAEIEPEPEPIAQDNASTEQRPMLSIGSTGKFVKELQERLISLGYSCGYCGADGEFGSATRAAVINFQSVHNLEIDGVVGPQTWAALDATKAVAPIQPAAVTPVIPRNVMVVTDVKLGDRAAFAGGKVYISAGTNIGKEVEGGIARVTAIREGAKHPYHLSPIRGENKIYGWVDADRVAKA